MTKIVTLSEVCILNPKHNLGEFPDNLEVSFVAMADVSEITRDIENANERNLSDVRKGFTHFKNDDVIVAKITPCYENGKMAVVSIPHDLGFGSTEFHVLRADSSKLLPKYLFYFLSSPLVRIQGEKNMTGSAGQKRVPIKFFSKLQIPLPSIEDQNQIIKKLEKADKLRLKRKRSIALLDDYLKATFLEMFGDPISNPMNWKTKFLGDICEMRRGASPRPIKKFIGGSVPWIKIGDATKGDDIYISSTKEQIIESGAIKSVQVDEGDLIFANCGVSLGFARIMKLHGCIHDGWLVFRDIFDGVDKIFLLFLINSCTNYLRNIAPDGTQPNLNTGIMKQFSIIIPPIEKQGKFKEIVDVHQQTKRYMLNQSEELEHNFNVLMQDAFTTKH